MGNSPRPLGLVTHQLVVWRLQITPLVPGQTLCEQAPQPCGLDRARPSLDGTQGCALGPPGTSVQAMTIQIESDLLREHSKVPFLPVGVSEHG